MHRIGYDFHTRFQQIAMMDSQTGEIMEQIRKPGCPVTVSLQRARVVI